jgi:hypothetical protein
MLDRAGGFLVKLATRWSSERATEEDIASAWHELYGAAPPEPLWRVRRGDATFTHYGQGRVIARQLEGGAAAIFDPSPESLAASAIERLLGVRFG